MTAMFDRHLFTQIGLDSGALTMLGSIVHSFGEPGEYRATVRSGQLPEATFYISVDRACAVAHVNIDLAGLVNPDPDTSGCKPTGDRHFVVHPKGYAVFHVSGGPGGYSVNVRRAEEDPELKAYDSRRLEPGDIFSAILFRPGRYSVRNLLSEGESQGESHGEASVTVAYPVPGDTAYRPPPAAVADCGERIEPAHIDLLPMQGLNLHLRVPGRIRIDLVEADDGPKSGDSTPDR
ncbi:MAG: hypothetical protein QOE71_4074 [Pseudonocardiales bacterium]|jgi:hypothetical protein|nr:hypothetical protein [Pseudonocardiales bacterium]